MTSIMNLPAIYGIHLEIYDEDDECYFLYYDNKLLDVYGTKAEAEQAAREHYSQTQGESK